MSMTRRFTRPSKFDRSDHVLLFTIWGLDELSDIIVGKVILTHLYPYITLNRSTISSGLIICGRLDYTEINKIDLCMDAKFPKKYIMTMQNAKIWNNIMHVNKDHQPTLMSSCSSNNTLFILFIKIHSFTQLWKCTSVSRAKKLSALGVVDEWSKVLTSVHSPFMVWSTLAWGTHQLRFLSWVFHVIFSFVHFISFDTLGGLCAFRKPFSIYFSNLRTANYILIKIFFQSSYIMDALNQYYHCFKGKSP